MKNSRPITAKSKERKKLIGNFQKSLGDTVVLLSELKNKAGINQGNRMEIDNIVEKLQEISRELPSVISRDWFQKVFGVIKEAADCWGKLFGG